VLVTNWSQYQNTFGGFVEGYYLPHSVYGYFANGGGTCFVVNLAPSQSPQTLVPPATNGKAGSLARLEIYATRRGLQTPGLTVQVEYQSAGALPGPSAPAPSGGDSAKTDGASASSDTPTSAPARPARGAAASPPPPTSTTPFTLRVNRG